MEPKDAFFIFLLALGLFIVSNFYKSYWFPSQEVIVENAKEGPGSNIKIAPTPAENLKHTYGAADKELPFCVFGEKDGKEYRITRLGFPEIRSSEPYTTNFNHNSCKAKDDFLGMVHNHEKGSCFPSDTDLFTFLSSEMDIFLIYCRNKDEKVFVGVTRDIFNSTEIVDL